MANFNIAILLIYISKNLKQLSSRCSKNKKWKNIKINDKYWSSYVQWRNLLLLTPYNYYVYLKRYFEKIVTNYFFAVFWSTATLKLLSYFPKTNKQKNKQNYFTDNYYE